MEHMIMGYIGQDRLVADEKGMVGVERIVLHNEHEAFTIWANEQGDPMSLIPLTYRKKHFFDMITSACEFFSTKDDTVDYVVVFTDIGYKDATHALLNEGNWNISDSIDKVSKQLSINLDKGCHNYEIINWVALNTFNVLYIYDVIRDSIRNEEAKTGIYKPVSEDNKSLLN
jgi:hypothetical protein